jgi:predicted extracellular nuclease
MNQFVCRALFALSLLCSAGAVQAQCISLNAADVPYTQNFDTLATSGTDNVLAVPGLQLLESGGGARDNELYAADTGASNTGDTYSYGAAGSSDRALGALQSGTLITTVGACFVNNTGAAIEALDIAYTGEQWRLGTADRADRIDVQYSLDATDPATGTWTDVAALAFPTPNTAAPTGAKDGNAAENRTALSANVGLSIASGATFWIRWIDVNGSGADDGLAVDDFSLVPRGEGGGGQPVLSISDTSAAEGDSGISPFFFTISLNQPAGAGGVSFDYATTDNTATAGSDYVAATSSATIAEGGTSVTIDIDVNGDADTEPNETFFVNVSNITGAIAGDAQGIGTINNDDVTLTPIGAVQGNGQMSPLVGNTVTVEGIVTGRKGNGFFVQSAEAEADADPLTSEGVFVFTGAAPPASAAVGNRVQVSGTVVEFIPSADPGQLPLTELGGAVSVTLLTIDNTLPTPVQLSAELPASGGALDQLERHEGMRVTAASFTVVAPTGGTTNEPNATGTTNGIFNVVVTGTPRPFREPGIQFPDPPPAGTIPPIPQWDFNPELLTVVSRAIGGTAIDVAAGAQIENLVGPLDYGFRRYTIDPDPAVTPTIAPEPAPSAARLPTTDEFTVASYNMERFFDTANDPDTDDPVLTPVAFANRLNKASLAIRDYLHAPDILGVVEVENLATLQALADKIGDDAIAAEQPDPQYIAYLEEGNDIGGIDVGLLVKSAEVAAGIDRIEVVAVTQLGADETWMEPDGDIAILNDRPPLQLDAVVHYADGRTFPITAIVVHQRSLNGAEDATPDGERVRAKRQRQAEYLAGQIQALQTSDPDRRIAVLGDFNAFEFNDGLTDAMNVVAGTPTPDNETAVAGDGIDLVNPDLLNLYIEEPADQRYSFVFDGNAQSLDHILVNQALGAAAADVTLDHARINADYPEVNRNDADSPSRLSDHDPAIAYFATAVADLSVVVEADAANVEIGETMSFAATVANAGPDDAGFPGVGFAVDAELPDLAVDAPAGWTCGTPTAGSGETSVACNADGLANAATSEFTITATTPPEEAGQTIALTAAVASQTQDLNPGNDSDSAAVAVLAQADLAVAVEGPATFVRGGIVEFTATAANLGPSAAPGMTIALWSNAPTASVETVEPEGWTCNMLPYRTYRAQCTHDGGPANDAVFAVNVSTGGSKLFPPRITVTAAVASAAVDPDLSNNRSSLTARRAHP